MLNKPQFKISQSRPLRPVFDPTDPHLMGDPLPNPSYGQPVGFAPMDPVQPYGLEVSITLKYGDNDTPLIQELLEKLWEIQQVLDEEVQGK